MTLPRSIRDARKLITRAFKPGSQCWRILRHLESGKRLTPGTAYALCGTLACHSRMSELREAGYPVRCKLVSVGDKLVGEYSL